MNGEQLELDTTGMVRSTDPDTSQGAAVIALHHAADDRQRALDELAAVYPGGLTDFDLARLTNRKQTSIGKRRGELVAAGWAERARADDGTTLQGTSDTGAPCALWRLTDYGKAQHAAGNHPPRPPRRPRKAQQ